ncbi:MAG: hypothetical protein FWD28_04385 [Treponema sp.]|nr:hypothetical protein [Treponema sp.]
MLKENLIKIYSKYLILFSILLFSLSSCTYNEINNLLKEAEFYSNKYLVQNNIIDSDDIIIEDYKYFKIIMDELYNQRMNMTNRQGSKYTSILNRFNKFNYSYFDDIGTIITKTKDDVTIKVGLVIAYNIFDHIVYVELKTRKLDIINLIKEYFLTKNINDINPVNEINIRNELLEIINDIILGTDKAKRILFTMLEPTESTYSQPDYANENGTIIWK